MANCKFFFSYARNDESEYLDDFFYKLRQSVMTKTGIKQPDLVAFRDTDDVDFGSKWTPELEKAIQASSVFVCMYTPSFFISDYCGKEVSIFQSRISEYAKTYKKEAPAILPVLWETPNRITIPSCLSEVQYLHGEIHEDYAKKGLLTISNLNRYHDLYFEFVNFLANKIVDTSNKHKLPQIKIRSVKDITSAFTRTDPNNDSLQENNNKWSLATKGTAVIYAVGSSHEIQGVKTNIEGYSDKSEYWEPFYPEEDEVGIILQQVISQKKLHYIPFQFSENLAESIREAEDNNCVAVLVVDPWSTKLDKYRKPISGFDEKLFINSAVVIIWNESDEETVQQKDVLYNSLHNSLSRCIVNNTNGVKDDIKTIDELKNIISIAIDEARARLLKRAKIFQTIPTDTISIPLLNATGV